jgi:hypothetical protein
MLQIVKANINIAGEIVDNNLIVLFKRGGPLKGEQQKSALNYTSRVSSVKPLNAFDYMVNQS